MFIFVFVLVHLRRKKATGVAERLGGLWIMGKVARVRHLLLSFAAKAEPLLASQSVVPLSWTKKLRSKIQTPIMELRLFALPDDDDYYYYWREDLRALVRTIRCGEINGLQSIRIMFAR